MKYKYHEYEGALFRVADYAGEVYRPESQTWEAYTDVTRLIHYGNPMTKVEMDNAVKQANFNEAPTER